MVYGDPESEHLMLYYLTDDGSYTEDLAQACGYEGLTYMYSWEDRMYNYGDELYLNLSDSICRISFMEDGISVTKYDMGDMDVSGLVKFGDGEFAAVSMYSVAKVTPLGTVTKRYEGVQFKGVPFVRDGKLYDAAIIDVGEYTEEGIAVIDLDTMSISTKTLDPHIYDILSWIYYLIPYNDKILVLLYYYNSYDTEAPYRPGFMLLDSDLDPIVDATTNVYFNGCKSTPNRPTGYGIDDEGRLWVEFCNNVLVIDEDGHFTTRVLYGDGKFFDVYGDRAYRIYDNTYNGDHIMHELYLSE